MKKSAFLLLMILCFTPVFSQSEETSESVPEITEQESKGFFTAVIDFANNAPYQLDLGCEPATNGATSFGSVAYYWTPDISTQIYFEKGTESDFYNVYSGTGKSGDSTTTKYHVKFYPFKKTFFMNKKDDHKTSIGLGIMGQRLLTESNIFTYMMLPSNPDTFKIEALNTEVLQYILGPCIEFNYHLPIFGWLAINTETTVTPFFYYLTGTEAESDFINAQDDTYYKPSQTITSSSVNFGIVNVKAHIDILKNIALATNYTFTRLKMPQLSWEDKKLVAEETQMMTNNLDVGLALITTKNTFVRIQGGIYRELIWTTINNQTSFYSGWKVSVTAGF